MISPSKVQALKALLFVNGATVFAFLDGATIPELPATLSRLGVDYACLYRGVLDPDMAEVAPYLVALERDAPLTDWALANGWGMNWGVFAISRADINALKRHFRRFATIRYGEQNAYFRYYDPRVLRNYLPTCTTEELVTFFGPVGYFVVADDDDDVAIHFLRKGDSLQQRPVSLREMFLPISSEESAVLLAQDPTMPVRGTLTARPEQFRQLGMSIYVERMRAYLHEIFPESKGISRKVLGQMIEDLTERAAGYKLVLETHVAAFIAAAWILGMDFDEKFPGAQEVLLDYEMDCGAKAEWLWDFIVAAAGTAEDGQ